MGYAIRKTKQTWIALMCFKLEEIWMYSTQKRDFWWVSGSTLTDLDGGSSIAGFRFATYTWYLLSLIVVIQIMGYRFSVNRSIKELRFMIISWWMNDTFRLVFPRPSKKQKTSQNESKLFIINALFPLLNIKGYWDSWIVKSDLNF